MRTLMIAGNWKMNNGIEQTGMFVHNLEAWLTAADAGRKVAAALSDKRVEIVIAPPFTSLAEAVRAKTTSYIRISAQNVHDEPKGAFTGEISLLMLEEAKCDYVLIGHSERRHVFCESDELLERKLKATLESRVLPIFCVGELLEERTDGKMKSVLKKQLQSAWNDLRPDAVGKKLVVAYEPVWAIGTGKTAGNDDAQEACAYIRSLAKEDFDSETAAALRILYGGSVKPENSAGILSQPDIDGLLIGGASLAVDSFEKILENAVS